MKSLFILLAAVLLAGCSVMTSDFSEMRRDLRTDKIIVITEERPAEEAETVIEEETPKPAEEAAPEPIKEEPSIEETAAIEVPAIEEIVEIDQKPEPEADIIIEERETVFVETESLKISGDSGSYTISDSGETITLRKEDIGFGFWQQLDSGFVYYDGIDNKICYYDGSVKIPLE